MNWDEYVQLALSYAAFSPNEDGSWSVEIPVLPGCVTWGETRAEAAIMAQDAVHGWLVTGLRFGDEVSAIDGYHLGYLEDASAQLELTYAETQS